jgi:hypothetical protein
MAGVYYQLYEQANDLHALDQAFEREQQARNAWSHMVEAAGEVYSKQLIFGVKEKGFPQHWKEQLDELDRGLAELKELRAKNSSSTSSASRDYLGDYQKTENKPPEVSLERIREAIPGKALPVHARVSDPSGVKSVSLRYRHMTQFEDYKSTEMILDKATGLYKAEIPGDFIVPEWDLIYFVEAIDGLGNGCLIPDLDLEMPYVVVRTGTNLHK